MKTIIAGSRRLNTDQELVWLVADAVIKSGWRHEITEVVCGGARGIDSAGKVWAESVSIPVKPFTPDWNKYWKAAGVLRNTDMADYADALILIWTGTSMGSADMKKKAEQKGLKLYEYIVI